MGNDTAADFVAGLEGRRRWTIVKAALAEATRTGSTLESDVAANAIAAAEVVAHGLGRPTQTDAYTESVQRFVGRARRPSRRLAERAMRAVEVAASPDGELAELWAESAASEWQEALDRMIVSLRAQ